MSRLRLAIPLMLAALFLTSGWQAATLMWANLCPTVLATAILSIPYAPFLFVIALGCLAIGVVMLIHAFHPLPTEENEKEGVK